MRRWGVILETWSSQKYEPVNQLLEIVGCLHELVWTHRVPITYVCLFIYAALIVGYGHRPHLPLMLEVSGQVLMAVQAGASLVLYYCSDVMRFLHQLCLEKEERKMYYSIERNPLPPLDTSTILSITASGDAQFEPEDFVYHCHRDQGLCVPPNVYIYTTMGMISRKGILSIVTWHALQTDWTEIKSCAQRDWSFLDLTILAVICSI